jgi:hypothetical protein
VEAGLAIAWNFGRILALPRYAPRATSAAEFIRGVRS